MTTPGTRIARLAWIKESSSIELSALLDGTLGFIEAREETTAADLAERFGFSTQAATNRMTKLFTAGVLDRRTENLPTGGVQYVYTVRKRILYEGCGKRGGVCDCFDRPCAMDESLGEARNDH